MASYTYYEVQIKLYTNVEEQKDVLFNRSMMIDPESLIPKEKPAQAQAAVQAQAQAAVQAQAQAAVPEKKGGADQPPKKSTVSMSQYPFFTYEFKYNEEMANLPFQEKMETFFNKDKLDEFIRINNYKMFENTDQSNETKNIFIQENMDIMILALFPTRFHVTKHNHNSYDLITHKEGFQKMLFNPISPPPYSYIRLAKTSVEKRGGAVEEKQEKKTDDIYTVKKVIWLNDLLNHPDYTLLMTKYIEFNNWYKIQLKKAEKYEGMPYDESERKNQKIDEREYQKSKTILDIKNKTYEHANNTYIKEYDEFNKFMKTYRDQRSNNEELQVILDMKTDNDVVKFYETMETIYREYILSENQRKKEIQKERITYITITDVYHLLSIINNGKNQIELSEEDIFVLFKMVNLSKYDFKNLFRKGRLTQQEKDTRKKELEKELKKIPDDPKNQKKIKEIQQIINRLNDGKSQYLPNENEIGRSMDDFKIMFYNHLNIDYDLMKIKFRRKDINDLLEKTKITQKMFKNMIEEIRKITVFNKYTLQTILKKVYKSQSQIDKENKEELSKLLNVGVKYVSSSSTSRNQVTNKKIEIVVLLDLIHGEINDSNANSVFCPYMSEYLGNQLVDLLKKKKNSKYSDDWIMDKNRILFSVNTMESNEIANSKGLNINENMGKQDNSDSNKNIKQGNNSEQELKIPEGLKIIIEQDLQKKIEEITYKTRLWSSDNQKVKKIVSYIKENYKEFFKLLEKITIINKRDLNSLEKRELENENENFKRKLEDSKEMIKIIDEKNREKLKVEEEKQIFIQIILLIIAHLKKKYMTGGKTYTKKKKPCKRTTTRRVLK